MKNIFKTDLDAVTYTVVVNELVEGFFDSNEEYVPHYGMMNAMCTFYNVCTIESKLDEKINAEMSVLDIVNILGSDDAFMTAFNKFTCPDAYGLNFANAYRDAMDIIDTKKSSIGRVIDMAKKALDDIVDKITPALSEDNIKQVGEIAKNMAENNNLSKTLVDEYIKSGRFKDVVSNITNNPDLSVVK